MPRTMAWKIDMGSQGTSDGTGQEVDGTIRGRQRRAGSLWWPTTRAWRSPSRKDAGSENGGIST